MGGVSPSSHFHIAVECWAVDLLQYTATLLGSSGQWISFSTMPHCEVSGGNRSPTVYRHTAREQRGNTLRE